MKKSLVVFVPVVAILVMGFKWVKLTPAGEKVRVLAPSEVTACKTLGQTNASLKHKIGPFKRKAKKVEKELENLGRNSAADMGGDTIVPKTEVVEGKQTFNVYKCVNP